MLGKAGTGYLRGQEHVADDPVHCHLNRHPRPCQPSSPASRTVVPFQACEPFPAPMTYQVSRQAGRIDLVVNNAGIPGGGPIVEANLAFCHRVFEVRTAQCQA